jgi:hypothetical protein
MLLQSSMKLGQSCLSQFVLNYDIIDSRKKAHTTLACIVNRAGKFDDMRHIIRKAPSLNPIQQNG